MRALKVILFFLMGLLSLSGCATLSYLTKLGWHQGLILYGSIPIQEMLEDEQTHREVKKKIQFIQEVKCYGEERLGLKRSGSYKKFYEMKTPPLYVITASPKDRLSPYEWHFPMVGKVTYKSFFTLEGALREKETLEAKGFDTCIQAVAAYSTLGWLKDPIFSLMLSWDEPVLANIILHEMAHATIYFKGETDLNEQIATFVGNRGSIEFLTQRYGPSSKEVREALDSQEDDLLFASWIEWAYKQLLDLYEKPISREEKLKRRGEIFNQIMEKFKELKSRFRTDCYQDFDKKEFNNAVLIAHRRYLHHLDRWEALYKYWGDEMKRFLWFLKAVKSSKENPSSYLERWMKERGLTFH
ncbi:MAG: aminopeptidase [Thermodesulfobacteriota bacterium]